MVFWDKRSAILLEKRIDLRDEFWFKIKADAMIKPEEYIGYFEDLI
jgi:hypothetical protein